MSRLNASTSPWRALRIRSASSTARKINFRSPYLLTQSGPEKSARAELPVTSLIAASVGSFGKNACGNLGNLHFVRIIFPSSVREAEQDRLVAIPAHAPEVV